MPITTVTWNVDADGDWSDAGDWSTDALPDSENSVTIATADVHTITYSTGSTTVHALTVGANDHFDMSGGSLDVLTTARFADSFTQSGGTFEAATVNITGTGTLTGGSATGSTDFNISGTTAIANYTLAGASVLNNSATTNETGEVTLGDDTGVNAQISNASTGTYAIAGDFGIAGGAASANIVNDGLFEKSAGSGTSVVGVSIASTATIEAVTGNLEFTGPTNTISGTLDGAGQITFGGGSVTTLSTGTVSVGTLGLYDSATLDLGVSFALSGNLADDSNGSTTLDVEANTLSLGSNSSSSVVGSFGMAFVSGTGEFSNAGALTLANMVFGGSIAFDNSGSVMQTGNVTVGDGSGNTPSITNSGTYDFAADVNLGENNTASVFTNTGTLEKTASSGTSNMGLTVVNSATISVADGTLSFSGALDNSGKITGSGTIAIIDTGSATLSAGTSLGVSSFDLNDSASLILKTGVNYSGVFDDSSNGTTNIELNGKTLTLSGASNTIFGSFGSAVITGAGELANSGTITAGNMVLQDSAHIDNTGTINQTANVQIGGGDGKVAYIVNAAGATYNLTDDVSIVNGPSTASYFSNSGTFTVTGGLGSGTITTIFNNLSGGTIDISSGSLVDTGILNNHATIEGTDLQINASGELELFGGTALSVSQVDLYSSSSLVLAANATYAGTFDDLSNGSTLINLGSDTLRLTGASEFGGSFGSADITGSGTLNILHASTIAYGDIVVGGTATLELSAKITAAGGIQIGDSSGDAASVVLGAGRVYDITADSAADISRGDSSASVFTNDGTFEKTAGTGTTVVSADFVNNGTISVTSGTIEFLAGTLTNNGTINGTETTDSSGDIFISAPSQSPHQADSFVFPQASAVPSPHAVMAFDEMFHARDEAVIGHELAALDHGIADVALVPEHFIHHGDHLV